MGASPSCTRRRRNRPDQREEILSGSPTQLQPSENLYSSTLSTASSDSESSESRRTSSRDLCSFSYRSFTNLKIKNFIQVLFENEPNSYLFGATAKIS